MFTEGWVEFKDKRTAKAVARSLNGQILGLLILVSCNRGCLKMAERSCIHYRCLFSRGLFIKSLNVMIVHCFSYSNECGRAILYG